MCESDQGARFSEKASACFWRQWRREHLNGRRASQIELFAEINVRKPSSSQQMRDTKMQSKLRRFTGKG